MRPAYGWYAISSIENRGSDHYIQCMREINMTTRTIALDALRYMWKKDPRAARAAYLRFMRGCKYKEIAQELQISVERARQLSFSGLSKMSKYLNRKYGKSIALAA